MRARGAAIALLVCIIAPHANATSDTRPDLSPTEILSTDAGLVWTHAYTTQCFARLGGILDDEDYSHVLRFERPVDNPSIVDATEALRDAQDVDVALLSDGTRMHVVAPFLTHRRARALARYAQSYSEQPDRNMCVFARTLHEDAQLRSTQRATLLSIACACFLLVAFGMRRAIRHAQT